MNPEILLRDPVFQLNLLLWMAKDQPANAYRVRPVFKELGFSVAFIEQPFKFPVETFRRIEASTLDIGKQPEPELILVRQSDDTAIYVECKAQSFGPESSTSRQARAHLIAAGPAFGEVYPPYDSCLLSYVIPESDRNGMHSCLSTLTGDLVTAGFATASHSVNGLAFTNNAITYTWDTLFATHTGATAMTAEVLSGVSDDTDPSPLLLVYSDEDCPNEQSRSYYRQALSHQVRACLLCALQLTEAGTPTAISADNLLTETTGSMFGYLALQKKKGLRQFVRHNIFEVIAREWSPKHPQNVRFEGNVLNIHWITDEQKKAFTDWLEDKATAFPVERPDTSQPGLFETPADGS